MKKLFSCLDLFFGKNGRSQAYAPGSCVCRGGVAAPIMGVTGRGVHSRSCTGQKQKCSPRGQFTFWSMQTCEETSCRGGDEPWRMVTPPTGGGDHMTAVRHSRSGLVCLHCPLHSSSTIAAWCHGTDLDEALSVCLYSDSSSLRSSPRLSLPVICVSLLTSLNLVLRHILDGTPWEIYIRRDLLLIYHHQRFLSTNWDCWDNSEFQSSLYKENI